MNAFYRTANPSGAPPPSAPGELPQASENTERIDAIVGELTVDQKVALLHQHQPALPEHGFAAFHTGQEALHGLAWSGPATVFPQAIGLASMWNPFLLSEIGAAVAQEVREFHHAGKANVDLNVWAPVVDLLRDPRAGRNEEGYSEDPYLTGVLSTAYCRGLSGPDPEGLLTAPTLKHFFAYNNENDRVTSSSDVRPRLLHEYYLRAFEPAIRGGAAQAVMLSYNLVNGRPNHVSPYIHSILRKWSRSLVVVSDAYAPTNLTGEQHYFSTPAESHAAALIAGLDSFTDRDTDPSFTIGAIREAVDHELLDVATIDRAVGRMLAMRSRLAPSFTPTPVDTAALAREAARQSIVLLKNDPPPPPREGTHIPAGPLLPLRSSSSAAVLGQLADICLEDWYSGTLPYAVTPLAGLRTRLGEVTTAPGVDVLGLTMAGRRWKLEVFDWGEGLLALREVGGKFLTVNAEGDLVADQEQPNGWVVRETFRLHAPSDTVGLLENVATGLRFPIEARELLVDGVEQATTLARQAEVAIVVVGNHPMVGAREATDRTTLELPPGQQRLIRAVVQANPRTALVIESGYPYGLSWESEHVPAILWMSHAGQETGNALADVLLGDVSPSGRLTQTWYASVDDLTDIHDYDIIKSRRTYLYTDATPVFPFGHGLSYSQFEYSDLRLVDNTSVTFDLRNAGEVTAAEVPQLYVSRLSPSRVHYPKQSLCGFQRIELAPGQAQTVTLELPRDALTHWDVRQGLLVLEEGDYEIRIGSSSQDIRLRLTIPVAGETLPDRNPFLPIRAADFDDGERVRFVPRTENCADCDGGDAVTGRSEAPENGELAGTLTFHDLRFDRPATKFIARVGAADNETLELRLDDPAGDLLARIYVPHTSGASSWTEVHTSLPHSPTGRHDLHLGFTGSARISDFWFE